MIQKIKEFISKAYYFLWNKIICETEPYTYLLTRQMIRHGVIFWLGFYVLTGYLFYHFFNDVFWIKILCGIGLFAQAWLIDHLVDQIRINPQRYSE